MMVTQQDAAEYRLKAEACRIKAAMATDRVIRAKWIKRAHDWELLARLAEKDEKAG